KYIAANLYTISPVKGFNFSFGNSIVYSDMNVHPGYLIPFLFYKSVDHTLTNISTTDNQNSQMFFNFSSRLIKHTHMYGSLFVDEFSVSRINDPDVYNFHSFKIGTRVFNWPIQNLSYTAEFSKSLPITYQHRIPSATYASNEYNLGYYLGDNSKELYADISFKPYANIELSYAYSNAVHGNQYTYTDGKIAVRYPVLEHKAWTNESHSIKLSYQFFTNCYFILEFISSNIRGHDTPEIHVDTEIIEAKEAQYFLDLYSPSFYHGNQNTFVFKFNLGF
ncbi:MAG: hypothetical protein MI922_05000, partial [Bacteroidales bacterium]|nr:hypothetical protein [Bacteroidales bacterium]